MIEAKSEKLWELLDREASLSLVVSGFRLAEGPLYSRRGYLLFTDIRAERIHKWERGQLSVVREKSNRANGLTFDHQGRLLVCEGAGRVTRTEKNGSITVLADKDLGGPNDLVYAIDGNIYFTDLPKGRVYQITRKGEVRIATEDCQGPNGIALSPNQQQLYVADYRGKPVRRYDLAADGTLRNGREFAQTIGDGIKTDERGNLWLAGEKGIEVYDSSGALLGTVETPERPTNLNWGEGFRGLYITTPSSLHHLPTRVPGTRTY